MPIKINGQTYYRTSEVCIRSQVSRTTLFRWLKEGALKNTFRDRRGWRLFTEDDVNTIFAESTRLEKENTSPSSNK
jgi:predicted site-specific integrase-resolvase